MGSEWLRMGHSILFISYLFPIQILFISYSFPIHFLFCLIQSYSVWWFVKISCIQFPFNSIFEPNLLGIPTKKRIFNIIYTISRLELARNPRKFLVGIPSYKRLLNGIEWPPKIPCIQGILNRIEWERIGNE